MNSLLKLILLSLIAGCSASTHLADSMTTCEPPRPELCAMLYQPVCGQLISGEFRRFANACMACADPDVVGYLPKQDSDC